LVYIQLISRDLVLDFQESAKVFKNLEKHVEENMILRVGKQNLDNRHVFL
jgi:hypothetical protein